MSLVRIRPPRPLQLRLPPWRRRVGGLAEQDRSDEAMEARIYQPAKTAMQQGRANTGRWLLEYEPGPRRVEPLMGWTSSEDTKAQVRLWFDSKEEAVAYAERHGIMYSVFEPRDRVVRPKAYADNFAKGRIGRWTH